MPDASCKTNPPLQICPKTVKIFFREGVPHTLGGDLCSASKVSRGMCLLNIPEEMDQN